jgi:hypothetical protein
MRPPGDPQETTGDPQEFPRSSPGDTRRPPGDVHFKNATHLRRWVRVLFRRGSFQSRVLFSQGPTSRGSLKVHACDQFYPETLQNRLNRSWFQLKTIQGRALG